MLNVQAPDEGNCAVLVTNAGGETASFAAHLAVRVPCQKPAVLLIPCGESTVGLCAEICWPLQPTILPQWADSLDGTRHPWTGQIQEVSGKNCVHVPVEQDGTVFLRFDCP